MMTLTAAALVAAAPGRDTAATELRTNATTIYVSCSEGSEPEAEVGQGELNLVA